MPETAWLGDAGKAREKWVQCDARQFFFDDNSTH
jgi:hypothetical protein